MRGESKIVSERAVKLCRVGGGISPHILNLDIKWNEWLEPPRRHLIKGKEPPVTHWVRDWGVGGWERGVRGAVPNVLEERNILRVCL